MMRIPIVFVSTHATKLVACPWIRERFLGNRVTWYAFRIRYLGEFLMTNSRGCHAHSYKLWGDLRPRQSLDQKFVDHTLALKFRLTLHRVDCKHQRNLASNLAEGKKCSSHLKNSLQVPRLPRGMKFNISGSLSGDDSDFSESVQPARV